MKKLIAFLLTSVACYAGPGAGPYPTPITNISGNAGSATVASYLTNFDVLLQTNGTLTDF